MATECRQVTELTIEYGFVALNAVGTFFFLIIACGSIKDYLKTRHETHFWLFLAVLAFLVSIRGISNILYEVFGFAISGPIRLNITFIAASAFCIFFIFVFWKKKHKGFKKLLKRKPAEKKPKHKVKEQKVEKKDAQELREGLKIVEEAYKVGVISLENYEEDKREINDLLEKNMEHELLREKVKKIETLILEMEEASEFENE